MADIWSPNNPGISGLKELTSTELAVVQQIAALGDPNANRLFGWDDTDNAYKYFTLGTGLAYDHSTHTLSVNSSGTGDFSTNTSSSVASEIVLFADTTGKLGKRATGSGLALLTSGVLSTVTAPSGTVVGTSDTQTLTNKDLTSGTNTFPTFNQNTTGSAAKWTTARNLAGNSVDGSANVAFANKFIVQGTTDTGLSAAQFLGALGTGIVKNTTTTGVLSIAVAGDFPTLNQSTSGNAATATALATGRTISISGDLTYTSPSFDGTGNVTAAGTLATVNSNVGSFTNANITVNAKGLITAAANGSAGTGTVTNTGGNLTANSIVLGAGTVDTKVVAGIITDGTSVITLGVNATTIGKLKMFGNTSGDATIQPTAAAGTATVQTLPATTGTLVNRVTTGNGVSASNTDGALAFTLGAITPSTVNGNTFTTGTYTLTGTAGKTLNFTNSLTLSGTDSTTMTFPSTSATIARTDAANTFTGTQTIGALVATTVNGNTFTTGTGVLTIAASKTLTVNNSIALTGTDSTTMTFPTTNATIARTDAAQTFTGIQTFSSAMVLSTGTVTVSGNTITYPGAAGTLATLAGTETLTNKRITSRVGSTSSSSTPTPTGDSNDLYEVTALAANATIGSPGGTPTDGQKIIIRIKDNGTARTLAFNAIYRASSDLALPSTTILSKTMYLGFVYNSTDSKWDFIAFLNNF